MNFKDISKNVFLEIVGAKIKYTKYMFLAVNILILSSITSCDNPIYQDCMYEGQRLNSLPHGRGKIWCPVNGTIYSNSHATYKGEWKHGKCHGEGVISVRDILDNKKYRLFRVRCEEDKCWSIEEDTYGLELYCKG